MFFAGAGVFSGSGVQVSESEALWDRFLHYPAQVRAIQKKMIIIAESLIGVCMIGIICTIPQDSIDVTIENFNAEIESGSCLEFIDDSYLHNEYHTTIRDLYIKNRGYEFSYFVTPSLGVEYGLGYNPVKSTLEYRFNDWENNRAHPGTDRTIETVTIPVREDFARSLSDLISAAVDPSHLRHYVRSFYLDKDSVGWESIRGDGNVYEFFDKSGNGAKCWSPVAGNSKELVQLMETICHLIEDNKPDELVNLITKIRTLTEKFRM